MGNVITRFAPSPTGYLHLGHAASASHAFGFAEERNGVCLLRIEDIDTTRCKPEFERGIYQDLDWLGFDWPLPARRQSDHFADYAQTLDALKEKGVLYRCFKTRKEIIEDIARAPHGVGDVYSGPEKAMSQDEELSYLEENKPFAWRLSLKKSRARLGARYERLSFIDNGVECTANPNLLGDVILARKDVGTSYHLACTHDDSFQGVTDIVRGIDLLESTHVHRLLQELMGWPIPAYHHHPLLTDTDGKKFSKRDKSVTIKSMRAEFISAQKVLSMARGLS